MTAGLLHRLKHLFMMLCIVECSCTTYMVTVQGAFLDNVGASEALPQLS